MPTVMQIYKTLWARRDAAHDAIIHLERRSGKPLAEVRRKSAEMQKTIDALDAAIRKFNRIGQAITEKQALQILHEAPGRI